ncbi:addiction module protein [Lentisalinibacter orientalis]|uniref:addiction module protein n=1 Tax=Lentisalinibacter orientalis TaxID=2992241 RepID=UPI00386FCBC2
MDTATLDKLRSEALALSQLERAQLAYELVRSLDEPADADADSAWDKEILKRLRAIDTGTARLIDRDELRRRLEKRLSAS